ncbi:hypothetical protein DFJ74DRAFT_342745 [Hyaloraphidium curvatum]|nr:hypothetical protein DFJ74DRAFT_342745 [Hyaloraphidium curvatum]
MQTQHGTSSGTRIKLRSGGHAARRCLHPGLCVRLEFLRVPDVARSGNAAPRFRPPREMPACNGLPTARASRFSDAKRRIERRMPSVRPTRRVLRAVRPKMDVSHDSFRAPVTVVSLNGMDTIKSSIDGQSDVNIGAVTKKHRGKHHGRATSTATCPRAWSSSARPWRARPRQDGNDGQVRRQGGYPQGALEWWRKDHQRADRQQVQHVWLRTVCSFQGKAPAQMDGVEAWAWACLKV